MKSITVFVMLDACRYDYIDEKHTPFMHGLMAKGFSSRLKPTFGFEPDAAYLAGLYPDEADGGAQFWYYPRESPFKAARFIPRLFNRLPEIPQKVIRKLFAKAARIHNASPNLSTAFIPFHLLDKFALPMKFGLDHPEFCPAQTIFDLLREKKQSWLYHASPEYRVNIKAACKRAENELNAPLAFAFLHIGNLDVIGHKFGPDTREIKKELRTVDEGLHKIYKIVNQRFDEINFAIMGDHGMIRVEKTIDLLAPLRHLPLAPDKDYLLFLDSTMARFWFFSDNAECLVKETMSGIKGGHVLKREEKNKYHLNYPHNRFGDLIFLTDPGNLIFPNFFQNRSPVVGMHGYDPGDFGQQSVLLIDSKKIKPHFSEKTADMRRVFPTLCDLLDIDKPHHCGLKTLVERI